MYFAFVSIALALDFLDIETPSWIDVHTGCTIFVHAHFELSELLRLTFVRGSVEARLRIVSESTAVFESERVAFT
jgi:hypothetical protein